MRRGKIAVDTYSISRKKEHIRRIQTNYKYLAYNLSCLEEIIAGMYQEEKLTLKELECIQHLQSTPIRANEELLKITVKKPRDVFECFLSLLKDTNHHLYQMLVSSDDKPDGVNRKVVSNHANMIRRDFTNLLENLETENGLIYHLYEQKVLTVREREDISCMNNTIKRSGYLLGLLGKKSPKDFDIFLRALEKTGQSHLAKNLRTQEESRTGYLDVDHALLNKYTTLAYYLSKGSHGNVYGPIPWKDMQLALKEVTFSHVDAAEKFKKRIEGKKDIWSSLEHKNLMRIQLVDFSRLPKAMFIVMEFAAGGSLFKTLRSLGSGNKLPVDVVTDWAEQIAEGMRYLHGNKIVHRDLKSTNILLMESFNIHNPHLKINTKIADFDDIKEHDHTTTLSFVGTCAYMAPEVLGSQRFSKVSDVWSYGVVLWEMLSGDIPHKGLEPTAIIGKAMNGKLDDLFLDPSFPKDYKRLLERCLHKKMTSRPSFDQIQRVIQDPSYLDEMLTEEVQRNATKEPTSIHELPFELLDMILQKSYRYYVSGRKQEVKVKDEFIIQQLTSVDFCWFKRLTRRRFKRSIWRHMSEFYASLYKNLAINRNNDAYIRENIEPNGQLMEKLRSADCLTDAKARLVCRVKQKRKSTKSSLEKSDLLHAMRSFDDAQLSTFVCCLRQFNQRRLARIEESGGVVVKASILTQKRQLLVAEFNGLRDKNRPRSRQTDKLIDELKIEDIEILNSVLDRHVVVWIWCKSEDGLVELQDLKESNELTNVFTGLSQTRCDSAAVSICSEQFYKNIAVRKLAIQQTTRSLDVNAFVRGMTKLRNKVYVLSRKNDRSPTVILVFDDQNPSQKKLQIKECQLSCDIASNEKENCLYISDLSNKCIWRITITRNTDRQYEATKWLTCSYLPYTMSTSNDGQLLTIERSDVSRLLIYNGSYPEHPRIVELPDVITCPHHAVETSTGDFIVLNESNDEENEDVPLTKDGKSKWSIYHVTSDGQIVIRSSELTSETQEVKDPWHLSLCLDDQVLVASSKVIILDSDLASHAIVDDTIQTSVSSRMFYDEEKKQLIVGRIGTGVNIKFYTFTLI